jgi:hypothetical protein
VRLDVARLCHSATTIKTLLLAPAGQSASFAGGTGTSSGTTVGGLFDVQVLASEGVLVCGMTTSTYTGTGPYTVSVYVTPDTYVGSDTTASRWRLVGVGQGIMNGGTVGAPSLNRVALDAPFYLPAGNYGVAVYHQSASGPSYLCNSSGVSSTFAGPDLSINPNPVSAPGIVRAGLFSGALLSPRQWNGIFHYTKVSLSGPGGYGVFGLGCQGSIGVPGNVVVAPPTLAATMSVNLTNLAQSVVMYWWGFSNTTSPLGPLPIDLTALGAPGCFARVSLDAAVVLVGAGGIATFQFSVPNDPALLGLQFYAQGLSLDPTANALGLVATDAAGFIVGQ